MTHAFDSLTPPVQRASTVVFDSLDAFVARKTRMPDGFTYGTTGTPTQRTLEQRIAKLDEAQHAIVFPSGQAAICVTMLAHLRAGDGLLIPESTYSPAKNFALGTLAGLGVNVQLYDPRDVDDLRARITPRTAMIWMESPGSVTMEVQDVPAMVRLARERGIRTAIDNTWASPLGFRALHHGVDFCIHACTKYFSGHSDVLMGSVSMNDAATYTRLRQMQATMGQAVSPEDCALMHRSLETYPLRWAHQTQAALEIARALRMHAEVVDIRFPALPGAADHAIWQRDFVGSGCVFTLQLTDAPLDAYRAFFATLRHFAIGASWGSVHSIAAFYPVSDFSDRTHAPVRAPLVRLSIGLEPVPELMHELCAALDAFTDVRTRATQPA
jgi:cysteine-S-conjugate beta-lyase